MDFVRDTPKGLHFPPKLPQNRSIKHKHASMAFAGITSLFGALFSNENPFFYFVNGHASIIIIMGLVEAYSRVCKYFEEIKHLHSRHDGDTEQIFYYVFSVKPWKIILFLLSFFTNLLTYLFMKRNPLEIALGNTTASSICLLISALTIQKEFNFEESPLNVALQIKKLGGLDYGSGMAHSYFHGYLKIVLPNNGTSEKGFKEFLSDYEGAHNIKFAVHKFFILIPKSQHCPPRLDSEFSNSIELSKELESKEIDRAGTSKRSYKSPVYKIITQGTQRKQYVSAEYATPVKTLFEAMSQNTPASNLYKEHRYDLVLNFYLTLKELLKNDGDLRNMCEVIFYDDVDDEGNYKDVGGIILKRIYSILKKTG